MVADPGVFAIDDVPRKYPLITLHKRYRLYTTNKNRTIYISNSVFGGLPIDMNG